MKQEPAYYFCTPGAAGSAIKIGALCIFFAAVAAGIFVGACYWVRAQVRPYPLYLREPPTAAQAERRP